MCNFSMCEVKISWRGFWDRKKNLDRSLLYTYCRPYSAIWLIFYFLFFFKIEIQTKNECAEMMMMKPSLLFHSAPLLTTNRTKKIFI